MSEKKDGEEKKDFEELEIQQDTGSLTWAQPRTKGDVPAARSGHTLTVVGSNAYLFGGCVEGDIVGPTDEIYILKLQPADSKSAMTWVKPKTGGATPKRGAFPGMAFISLAFLIPIASRGLSIRQPLDSPGSCGRTQEGIPEEGAGPTFASDDGDFGLLARRSSGNDPTYFLDGGKKCAETEGCSRLAFRAARERQTGCSSPASWAGRSLDPRHGSRWSRWIPSIDTH